jgi:hypothetical protein
MSELNVLTVAGALLTFFLVMLVFYTITERFDE